jgi:hypothetical protein
MREDNQHIRDFIRENNWRRICMEKKTVMDVTKKVLGVIQQYSTNSGLMLADDHISLSATLYSYGSIDEFRGMISELENTFDICIESDDIGECTVQAFIEMIIEKVIA